MSKIYDALERAKQQSRRLAPPLRSSSSIIQPGMEEEMKALYQAVRAGSREEDAFSIEFIGSVPEEGASTVAREFAKVVALQFSKSVLLIDADYAQPTQRLKFDLADEDDLQKVVESGLPPLGACQQVAGSTLAVCQAAGDSSFIPSVCESGKINLILEDLKKNYSVIVIDSPPASVSSIGFDLCRKVDRVALVVEAEKTRWPVALNIKEKVEKNGGTISGIVFNKRKFYIPQWLYKRL
jgi:protein-tyrosine kinase